MLQSTALHLPAPAAGPGRQALTPARRRRESWLSALPPARLRCCGGTGLVVLALALAAAPAPASDQAVVVVEDLVPQPFTIEPPGELPEYLQGGTVYWYPVGAKQGKGGVLKFKVEQGGPVFLVASYHREGNRGGNWSESRLTPEQLAERGWQTLGPAPWDDKIFLFHRVLNRGESYEIRTNKYHPPKLVLPAAGKALPPIPRVVAAGAKEPKPPASAGAPPAASAPAVARSAAADGDELPLPPAADKQKAVLRQLDEIYHFQQTTTPAAKRALAKELRGVAQKAATPTESFVVWRKVMDLGVELGDARTALAALDAIDERFSIDTLAVKAKTLQRVADAGPESEAARDVAQAALSTLAEAVDDRRYATALDLLDLAQGLLQAIDTAGRKQLARFRTQLQPHAKLRTAADEALELLKTDPNHAEAHLAAARWFCFGKDDWPRGLPHFAAGSDEGLAAAARRDLACPQDAREAMLCGDGWWDLAVEADVISQPPLRDRARTWYAKARPGLSGLALRKVDARLSEAVPAGAKVAEGTPTKEKDNRPAEKDHPSKGKMAWSPVPSGGVLTRCMTLGPFAQAVPDAIIVSFILKAKPNAEILSHKLVEAQAQSLKGEQRFLGPTENNTKTFYVFWLRTEHPQNVELNCNTEVHYKQSEIAISLDSAAVPPQGVVPLKRGSHLLIVRQNHNKSDRPGNSWVTVTARGDGLEQGF